MRPSLKTLHALMLAAAFGSQVAGAIPVLTGFDTASLGKCDDKSSGAVALGFTANFFGRSYTSVFVNNNGNVTFDSVLSAYTPFDLAATHRAIIAPFFADVDTRGAASGVASFGTGVYGGHDAFGVTWDGVGYYGFGTDKLNRFQLLLVSRSDLAPGDFDIYFNYEQMQWESGNASGGRAGLGGFAARAGYSNGDPNTSYELAGSAQRGALVDGGRNSLVAGSNIGQAGRYLFEIRNGVAAAPDAGSTLTLTALTFGTLWSARRHLARQDKPASTPTGFRA